MHTKVPGRRSADRVFLFTEKASVICAETRAGGKRGEVTRQIIHVFWRSQYPS